MAEMLQTPSIRGHLKDSLKKHLPGTAKTLAATHRRIIHRDWALFARRLPNRYACRNQVSINTFPDDPRANGFPYTIVRLIDYLGYSINNPKARYQCDLYWDDSTQADPKLITRTGINSACHDISKTKVDRLFEEVFGYQITVDPLTFQGRCVQKSDENGIHDGQLIECPIKRVQTGCVYQKYIDTSVGSGLVDQMRVPIFFDKIPFVCIKYKFESDPFTVSHKGDWKEISECLNREELEKIIEFCRCIGLDYGDLDVLRDRFEQRIYIVDANKTPTYHFGVYPDACKREMLVRMAEAFRDNVIAKFQYPSD